MTRHSIVLKRSRKLDNAPESKTGIFPKLLNCVSFADKVTLGVWRTMRQRPAVGVELQASRSIGGKPDGVYSRWIPLILSTTGNPGDLKYGRLHRYRHIPFCQLTLRSVEAPLDEAQVASVLNALFYGKRRTNVSQVEMTFDTTGTSVRSLRQLLFTRARRLVILRDTYGRETMYVGGTRSRWQLRVYQKTSEIVRIEFVLRRPFLREHGIHTFEDITLLGGIDLHQMAIFQTVNQSKLKRSLSHIPSGWRKQLLLDWPRRRPLQELTQALRKDHKIDPTSLFSVSRIQQTLDRMGSSFVW
jgi:hypothetical protein